MSEVAAFQSKAGLNVVDPGRLLALRMAPIEQRYTERDTLFYALSLGLGAEPTDPFALRFCFERDLEALPCQALVLGSPGFWLKEAHVGVDWVRVLHGEQRLELARPLAASGHVISEFRVTDVVDKGPSKGLYVLSERRLHDFASGDLLATLHSISVCRGDGGIGGRNTSLPPPAVVPCRAPDFVVDCPTLPHSALLYRLNGDFNPLHADPEVAHRAGFPRPILHGLASMGIAQVALLRHTGRPAAALRSLGLRFAAPMYPGEVLSIELWHEANEIVFRGRVVARDVIVLDHGRAGFIDTHTGAGHD